MKKVMVKNRLGILCAAVLFFLAAGCQSAAPGYKTITAAQGKQMMDSGGPYTLVDVRTADEYQQGHIPGAELIPVDTIAARAGTDLPNKSAVILVYCRSGARAATAARALVSMGYTSVYDLGGIINWSYDLVTGD